MSLRRSAVVLGIATVVAACRPAAVATATPGAVTNSIFPATVAGLPVISVAHAVDLQRSGRLDGQAVAVAGFYSGVEPSCPMPGEYIGPLHQWCGWTTFTDAEADARLCTGTSGNDTACHGPTGVHLSPFWVRETSGAEQPWMAGIQQPDALVLIGHSGDPRQWQCTAETQSECAAAFVVDRVAWADGHDVPLQAPVTGTVASGARIVPRLTLDEASAAIDPGQLVVTGAPFRAGDIASLDPRWSPAGDDVVWLVRSVPATPAAPGAESRPERTWLVDDGTGKAIGNQAMTLDSSFQPARLWPIAVAHGIDCCAGGDEAFLRVTSAAGAITYEGLVSGSTSGGPGDVTTFGGGYGSNVLVLPAGMYSVEVWLASDEAGVAGSPRQACRQALAVEGLESGSILADFPAGQACTITSGPRPTPAF